MIIRSQLSDFEGQRSGSVLEQYDDRDELAGDIAVDVSQNAQKGSHLPLAIVLFVFCLSIYMLTYVGKLTSADEISMLATAKSLTQHGSFTSDQLLWTFWEFGWQAQGNLGADGHLYSKKGIGVPLLVAAHATEPPRPEYGQRLGGDASQPNHFRADRGRGLRYSLS